MNEPMTTMEALEDCRRRGQNVARELFKARKEIRRLRKENERLRKESPAEVDATKLAEFLHGWMDNLEGEENKWQVSSSCFLPANVTTDYGGVQGFIRTLAEKIRAFLDGE